MITKEQIKGLADLSRIELTDEETEKLTKDVDSILVYVGQIKDAVGDLKFSIPDQRNIMRDDVVTNVSGQYTETLLNSAPARDGQYVEVKKILG
jgi:aspartyl-tRNA(Asn)/glutamyl-tRNA(Gln) amidotransferase subunit C